MVRGTMVFSTFSVNNTDHLLQWVIKFCFIRGREHPVFLSKNDLSLHIILVIIHIRHQRISQHVVICVSSYERTPLLVTYYYYKGRTSMANLLQFNTPKTPGVLRVLDCKRKKIGTRRTLNGGIFKMSTSKLDLIPLMPYMLKFYTCLHVLNK